MEFMIFTSQVTFFMWPAEEPSDKNYTDLPCVQMTCGKNAVGTWGAMKCEIEHQFICEKSPIEYVESLRKFNISVYINFSLCRG